MFLTRQELATLTGCSYKRLQIAELRRLGIPHFINRAGYPIVVKAILEGRKEPANDEWQSNVLRKA